MANKITFTYEDVEYTLEYNRSTVKAMERAGFDIESISSKPMTMLPMLYEGAFRANHSGIKRKTLDEIYKSLNNKEELYETLIEMYGETLTSLMENTDEDLKNTDWASGK